MMANTIQYYTQDRLLEDCNAFYITVSWPVASGNTGRESFPFSALQLSFDHANKRIMVHITDATFAT
jgi:hypothetical protein